MALRRLGGVGQAEDPPDQLLRHQPVPRPRGEGGVPAEKKEGKIKGQSHFLTMNSADKISRKGSKFRVLDRLENIHSNSLI